MTKSPQGLSGSTINEEKDDDDDDEAIAETTYPVDTDEGSKDESDEVAFVATGPVC
jgi:hypothetical protein